MSNGYIYLLQEREFISLKQNIYKIGKTTQENLKRFLQYPKQSLLLAQISCSNCSLAETALKSVFQQKFKQRKDIGIEYFEGNVNEMILQMMDVVKNIILNEPSTIQISNSTRNNCCTDKHLITTTTKPTISVNTTSNYVTSVLTNKFQNFLEDELFGGTKQLIRFTKTTQQITATIISPYIKIFLNNGIFQDYSDHFEEIRLLNLNYFDEYNDYSIIAIALDCSIIDQETTYDLKSDDFITEINNIKLNITIEHFTEFLEYHKNLKTCHENINIKIKTCFICNTILNKEVSCDLNDKHFKSVPSDLIEYSPLSITLNCFYNSIKNINIYKINNKFYDEKSFLFPFCPYYFYWNNENNYYFTNEYDIIIGDVNIVNRLSFKQKKLVYIFKPYEHKSTMKNFKKEIQEIRSKYNTCYSDCPGFSRFLDLLNQIE